MRITRKRLKKIIKNKNQSRRKYKKRKNKRRRKKRNTLTKNKKFNLKNKSLKNFKGGAKSNLPILLSTIDDDSSKKSTTHFAFKMCQIDNTIPKIENIFKATEKGMGDIKSTFYKRVPLYKNIKFKANLSDPFKNATLLVYINDIFLFIHNLFEGEMHKERTDAGIDLLKNPLIQEYIVFDTILGVFEDLDKKELQKRISQIRQLFSFFNEKYKWEKIFDITDKKNPKIKYEWLGCKDKRFCGEGVNELLLEYKEDGKYQYAPWIIEPIIEGGKKENVQILDKDKKKYDAQLDKNKQEKKLLEEAEKKRLADIEKEKAAVAAKLLEEQAAAKLKEEQAKAELAKQQEQPQQQETRATDDKHRRRSATLTKGDDVGVASGDESDGDSDDESGDEDEDATPIDARKEIAKINEEGKKIEAERKLKEYNEAKQVKREKFNSMCRGQRLKGKLTKEEEAFKKEMNDIRKTATHPSPPIVDNYKIKLIYKLNGVFKIFGPEWLGELKPAPEYIQVDEGEVTRARAKAIFMANRAWHGTEKFIINQDDIDKFSEDDAQDFLEDFCKAVNAQLELDKPQQPKKPVLAPPPVDDGGAEEGKVGDVQESGLQESGLQESGLQESGVQESGLQESGEGDSGEAGDFAEGDEFLKWQQVNLKPIRYWNHRGSKIWPLGDRNYRFIDNDFEPKLLPGDSSITRGDKVMQDTSLIKEKKKREAAIKRNPYGTIINEKFGEWIGATVEKAYMDEKYIVDAKKGIINPTLNKGEGSHIYKSLMEKVGWLGFRKLTPKKKFIYYLGLQHPEFWRVKIDGITTSIQSRSMYYNNFYPHQKELNRHKKFMSWVFRYTLPVIVNKIQNIDVVLFTNVPRVPLMAKLSNGQLPEQLKKKLPEHLVNDFVTHHSSNKSDKQSIECDHCKTFYLKKNIVPVGFKTMNSVKSSDYGEHDEFNLNVLWDKWDSLVQVINRLKMKYQKHLTNVKKTAPINITIIIQEQIQKQLRDIMNKEDKTLTDVLQGLGAGFVGENGGILDDEIHRIVVTGFVQQEYKKLKLGHEEDLKRIETEKPEDIILYKDDYVQTLLAAGAGAKVGGFRAFSAFFEQEEEDFDNIMKAFSRGKPREGVIELKLKTELFPGYQLPDAVRARLDQKDEEVPPEEGQQQVAPVIADTAGDDVPVAQQQQIKNIRKEADLLVAQLKNNIGDIPDVNESELDALLEDELGIVDQGKTWKDIKSSDPDINRLREKIGKNMDGTYKVDDAHIAELKKTTQELQTISNKLKILRSGQPLVPKANTEGEGERGDDDDEEPILLQPSDEHRRDAQTDAQTDDQLADIIDDKRGTNSGPRKTVGVGPGGRPINPDSVETKDEDVDELTPEQIAARDGRIREGRERATAGRGTGPPPERIGDEAALSALAGMPPAPSHSALPSAPPAGKIQEFPEKKRWLHLYIEDKRVDPNTGEIYQPDFIVTKSPSDDTSEWVRRMQTSLRGGGKRKRKSKSKKKRRRKSGSKKKRKKRKRKTLKRKKRKRTLKK